MIENTNIESYLEFKKSSPVNDDNEDTVFSPVKNNSSGASPTHTTNTASSNAFKSINIKISAATALALNNNKKKLTDDEELQIEGSDSDQSQSPKSVDSHSNSPSAKKHALVDYEYDSDEDENDENKVNDENQEPLAKRAATDSNTYFKESSINQTDTIKSTGDSPTHQESETVKPNLEIKESTEDEPQDSYGPSPDLQNSEKMSVDSDLVDSKSKSMLENSDQANTADTGLENSDEKENVKQQTEISADGDSISELRSTTVNNIHMNENETEPTEAFPNDSTEASDKKKDSTEAQPETDTKPTTPTLPDEATHKTNGFHPTTNTTNNHITNNHTEVFNRINTNTKYDLNESTESTATSLFMNISTKIVGKANALDLTNGQVVNTEGENTLTTAAADTNLSPVSLTSLEPANKRARLSNS